jgi:hypothetical protein
MSTYPQRMFDACSEFEAIDSPQGVADRLAKILSSGLHPVSKTPSLVF